MDFCNPACNTTQITTYPIPCRLQDATRQGGFERFILLDCDQVFVDLTDDAEWQTLADNDKLIVSPPGFGTIIKPETTKEKLTACSPEQVIDEISGFDWMTKLFDNSSYLDFDFEDDLKNLTGSKTIMWIGCDGLLYYSNQWATGENPGFGGIAIDVYRVSEPAKLQELHADVRFNTYKKGIKAIPLTDAVLAVLNSI